MKQAPILEEARLGSCNPAPVERARALAAGAPA
jgi:hypothetical protein